MYLKMSYQSRAFIPKTPFLLSCIKAEYFLRLLVYFIYFTARLGKTKAKRGKVTPCNISFLKCSVFLLSRNDGEVLQKLAEIFRYFMVGITILVAAERDTRYLCSLRIGLFYSFIPKRRNFQLLYFERGDDQNVFTPQCNII